MARGVSYPGGSVVEFQDISNFGEFEVEYCCECGNEIGDNFECQDCGGTKYSKEIIFDDSQYEYDWECFTENLKDRAKKLFTSFEPCDKWLDREDKAILENSFSYFGISEYCGVASIWIAPKEDYEKPGIRDRWIQKIASKFSENFGNINKVGSFSNVEQIFKRK